MSDAGGCGRLCARRRPAAPAKGRPLPRLSRRELADFFASDFPQSTATIEVVEDAHVTLRQAVDGQHLRPGGTVSGPVMMALADWAAYAEILAEIGIVPLAVTTSFNINFLRRPAPHAAVLADARLLKLGARLAVVEVEIRSEGEPATVAHATATYSIPPPEARGGNG